MEIANLLHEYKVISLFFISLTNMNFSDHPQISDIVVGKEDNVSAREALLRWARRSTARYPGVRVNDFTSSWRDGLAFSALVHRNRPDLLDWRKARNDRPRERLEQAFHIVEKEYGVTRLLDPEGKFKHIRLLNIQS